MDFRWAAGIAIWTIMVGPIFSGPAFMPKNKHRPARVVYLGTSKSLHAAGSNSPIRPQSAVTTARHGR